jgi:hypothetical protein
VKEATNAEDTFPGIGSALGDTQVETWVKPHGRDSRPHVEELLPDVQLPLT